MYGNNLFSRIFLTVISISELVLRADNTETEPKIKSDFEVTEIELHIQFKDFISRFNKSYTNDPDEYVKRKYIFKESLLRQYKLNKREGELGGKAVYGVNMFSDMTPQEFKEFLKRGSVRSHGGLLSNENTSYQYPPCNNIPKMETPSHQNWHEKGKVTPIKNQGKCGSCWAFTAVELVESQWAIKTGTLKSLSVQELISCGAGLGCKGGITCTALKWLVPDGPSNSSVHYTLASEAECPYEDKETSCDQSLKHSSSGITITYPCCKNEVDELTYLKPVVAFIGTVAVNVDATMWHDYISGIIQHHCTGQNINHAVQIVGYDTTGVVHYWIVRNSWGTQFGDNGYLYIEMGKKLCGLDQQTTFVLL